MAKYRKSYFSMEEYKLRAEIFEANRIQAEKDTAASPWATFGVNEFSDLTEQEFSTRMGLHPKSGSGEQRDDHYETETFPEHEGEWASHVDWSDYTLPVKDQASCGSCWAFAATGSTEINCAIHSGEKVDLAEQEMVDCAKADYDDVKYFDCHGCSGGWMSSAMQFNHDNAGQILQSEWEYTASDHECNFEKVLTAKRACHIKKIYSFPVKDWRSLANAIQVGSVAVGVSTKPWKAYTGGIMSSEECIGGQENITHGVVAVGYGHDEEKGVDYWLLRNSWAGRWGESGYARVERSFTHPDRNACGITEINSYAQF